MFPINLDFRDLFAELSAARSEYLVVGGYALGFHGQPRYTKDVDIWVGRSPENAARVHLALRRFGAPLANLTEADLQTEKLIFRSASSRIESTSSHP